MKAINAFAPRHCALFNPIRAAKINVFRNIHPPQWLGLTCHIFCSLWYVRAIMINNVIQKYQSGTMAWLTAYLFTMISETHWGLNKMIGFFRRYLTMFYLEWIFCHFDSNLKQVVPVRPIIKLLKLKWDVMASWNRPGNKPLTEPMTTLFTGVFMHRRVILLYSVFVHLIFDNKNTSCLRNFSDHVSSKLYFCLRGVFP